ncbi:penicillin acylase family protein [Acidobacteria bacterium AB60]|nr:penicillin acylase family protein [Acidobacteria bacterium AB60]
MADSGTSTASSAKSSPRSSARRRTRPWLRILVGGTTGILLLAVICAAAGVLWLRSVTKASLPQLDGDPHISGLSAPVMVRRDAHGVPHIQAATQDDLFVAQGYVTAQDRLWQMDSFRRNANGDLAEVLGSRLILHDKVKRVMGFRRIAQRMYAHLSPEQRRYFDDYARGVNLFIEQHQDSLPEEFRILGYKPKPWSGADSMSVATMMVDMLDTQWDIKRSRAEIAAKLNNPKLEAQLYPVGSWRDRPPTGDILDLTQPQPAPPSSDDDEDDDRTRAALDGPFVHSVELSKLRAALGRSDCDGCALGSNNWVVSGKHTASGKPLLANDMHLSLTEPNIWFMADLQAPGYHVAGVTLPGMPTVIAGHNEHIAWGFTALFADVQDLYRERLDGKGNYQAADGSWKPLLVEHEVIPVRGGSDVKLDVESTEHGPLLTPIFSKDPQVVALKWNLFDPNLNAVPLYAMNVAQNWAEFSAALGTWDFPAQNVVYADDQGHIAYHAVGSLPMRPGGLAGKLIQDAQHEWQGYIPFDALPSAFDPPSGFLATANGRVTTEKSAYPITLEWESPYRIERIYKLLQGRDHLTPKDMLAVQTDIYSEVDQELAHRFAYAIDHSDKPDDRLRKAADVMRSWDGRLTTDSAAASLVDQARIALWSLILEPKLGKLSEDYRWGEKDFAEEEIVMHGDPDWLPPGYKNWDAVLTEAVRRGMQRGDAPADITKWTYGSWHVVDIEHPLAPFLPLLSRIAGTGRQPLSGDTTTVKQVGVTLGPSQRFTMDWSNIDGSTENIVLGESGNPYSPYFRDQWNDWYNGTTFALPFTQAAVAANTRHTLRLLP